MSVEPHQPGPIYRLVTVLTGIPALVAIFLVSLHVYEQQKQVEKANYIKETIQYILLYDEVAYHLARERGLSTGIVASGDGASQLQRLKSQWNETDAHIAQLKHFTPLYLDVTLANGLKQDFLLEAEHLSELREKIEAGDPGEDFFLFYSSLNQLVLDNAQVLRSSPVGIEVEALESTLLSVMTMKERAGQIRGLLNGVFSRGASSAAEYRLLQGFIISESAAERMAGKTIPGDLSDVLDGISNSDTGREVQRIQQLYLSQSDNLRQIQGPDPQQWFYLASERIQRIGDLRLVLHNRMMRLAEHKLHNATSTKNWSLAITVLVSAGLIWGVYFARLLEKHLTKTTLNLMRSIRDLEMTQEQLIESEKLAALGRMVAGVAHEVNTPIGIAVTASSLVNETVHRLDAMFQNNALTNQNFNDSLATLKESGELLDSNLYRASTLVHDFKQTAVDQINESLTQFNLQQVLLELLSSLRSETKKTPVSPRLEGDSNLTLISLPGVLTQIVANLVLNSLRHAFDNQVQPEISIHYHLHGDNVVLEYTDNGSGIRKSLHNKIFEPFFTTKRGSGGTGLGLNLVFNLVTHKLAGKLKFDSREGQGVHFTLTFPRVLSPKGQST